MFKVYASLDDRIPLNQVADSARRAEEMGYDGIIVLDGLHDGLVSASIALQATTTLKVLTVALAAIPRSPMIVAKAAWNLQAMSGGRFQLGLGEQIRSQLEDRYGSDLGDDPSLQMREYIHSLRALFDSFQHGTELAFNGEYYQFNKLEPWMNPGPINCEPPPIYITAVGKEMMRLAGQFSDGVLIHPTHSDPGFIQENILPSIKEGAQLSTRGTPPEGPLITALIATGRDRDAVLHHKERRRNLMSIMFSTPAYWESLQYLGEQEVGPKLQKCADEKHWDELPKLITDEILNKLIIYGTYSNIGEEISRRFSGLSDWVIFPLPENPVDDEAAASVVSQLRNPTTGFRMQAKPAAAPTTGIFRTNPQAPTSGQSSSGSNTGGSFVRIPVKKPQI